MQILIHQAYSEPNSLATFEVTKGENQEKEKHSALIFPAVGGVEDHMQPLV